MTANGAVFEDDAEGGEALVENLAAVSDEEELERALGFAQAAVVEGGEQSE